MDFPFLQLKLSEGHMIRGFSKTVDASELVWHMDEQDRTIKVLDSEEKTKGGIIIPDTAKEKPQEGEVVAVGNGAKTEDGKIVKMDVKVGDRVLFGKWSGTEVKIDGKEYSIMKESDIMGITKGK